jgi:hypothetical protein
MFFVRASDEDGCDHLRLLLDEGAESLRTGLERKRPHG